MEVGILNTKTENRKDPLTKINCPDLPPTHSSSSKSNRHIHSASFGSASSTCSSNSSSSLSASGMAYSPAVRGHRDKLSSSGRTLNNTANIDNPYRKKSSASDITYAQNSYRYNENGTKENGHNANFSSSSDLECVGSFILLMYYLRRVPLETHLPMQHARHNQIGVA